MPNGRPSKRTAENRAKILEYLRAGQPVEYAAAMVGMDDSTFYRWQAEDDEFREDVSIARKAGYGQMLLEARVAAKGDWRGILEMLARLDPANFGRRIHVSTDEYVKGISDQRLLQLLEQSRRDALPVLDAEYAEYDGEDGEDV